MALVARDYSIKCEQAKEGQKLRNNGVIVFIQKIVEEFWPI
jgi:hypothetical protein